MSARFLTYPTPNPQSVKFLFDKVINNGRPVSLKQDFRPDEHWAQELFELRPVEEIFIADRSMTITLKIGERWSNHYKQIIEDLYHAYDELYGTINVVLPPDTRPEEVIKIDNILTDHIRQSLQRDGGDLECVQLEGKRLYIRFIGSCASCPSSIGGTLRAITQVLRTHYDPDIEIIII